MSEPADTPAGGDEMSTGAAVELIRRSPLFDEAFYLAVSPDARAAGADPATHYAAHGSRRGGADFDGSWYWWRHPDVAAAGMHPLVHYETYGRAEGRVACPDRRHSRTPGALPRRSAQPLVMVVGHAISRYVFGAEASLLDVLAAFEVAGFDTVVMLPHDSSDDSSAYLDRVVARTTEVHHVDVGSRRCGHSPDPAVVAHFIQLIDELGPQVVHVNTIVPDAPLAAARHCGIPAVTHAREVPDDDDALCERLQGSPAAIAASVVASCDLLLSNSLFVATRYGITTSTAVVLNAIDAAQFDDLAADAESRWTDPRRPVRVGLIGAATARKGIDHFAAVAARCADWPEVRFVAIGPADHHGRAVLGGVPDIEHIEYVECARDAMAEVDVVVSLSVAHESFSRVLCEAMAAGRPVIAWQRGAIDEVVGGAGRIVPYGSIDALVDGLRALIDDGRLRQSMRSLGRARAREFSHHRLQAALGGVYRSLVPSDERRRAEAADATIGFRRSNVSPFREPFFSFGRVRWATMAGVAFAGDATVIGGHLLGRRLVSARVPSFDESTGRPLGVLERVDDITSIDSAGEVHGELLAAGPLVDGHPTVYAANGEACTVSQYAVSGHGGITFVRSIAAADPCRFLHGVRPTPDGKALLLAVSAGSVGIWYQPIDGEDARLAYERLGWVPKDAAFIGATTIATTWTLANNAPWPQSPCSAVTIAASDDGGRSFRETRAFELPFVSIDGVAISPDGWIVIADQPNDRLVTFDATTLVRGPDIVGYSFPHQPTFSPDGRLLAVACYGDSEVRVRRWVPLR